ncbi:GTPase domain-containing protein [Promethearchaeum syntrophicum]|uniref:GTPase domain-containing protein n=1 Tax=Promethearchaeum syntrophicum TaxID=2594042 RepID=A0A5B9D9Z5_9ARCH|nr:GTPase domain-containing protein [Candidatus Prometheoarchaeum syntrophicum]QEE15570.1 hypothetical protein DSAG12_01396 [Candidatus Prometheoarchaeum syntrophicum]
MPKYFSTPKYVTIDLFGKVGCGKTTIFELFAEKKFLKEGGNLSYDFRTYYARCWVLRRRWEHTMVFLTDPKLEMRWKDLRAKHLRKLLVPTNILLIVSDSTLEDVNAIKQSFKIWPRIKRKMIIFIIANMQDLPGRLSGAEIKKILNINDILEINATDGNPETRIKIEEFIEEATIRYFRMLAKRGLVMSVLDEDEIGLGKNFNEKKENHPSDRKYSARIKEIKEKRSNGI